jgi:hypothetical protein
MHGLTKKSVIVKVGTSHLHHSIFLIAWKVSYISLFFPFLIVIGMSDLCSPMIVLLNDEADAFWCFERLMRRLVYTASPLVFSV